jgi:hypothetical protein
MYKKRHPKSVKKKIGTGIGKHFEDYYLIFFRKNNLLKKIIVLEGV